MPSTWVVVHLDILSYRLNTHMDKRTVNCISAAIELVIEQYLSMENILEQKVHKIIEILQTYIKQEKLIRSKW